MRPIYGLLMVMAVAGCARPTANDSGLVGLTAKDFKVQPLSGGKPVSLSEQKGKLVLLDFWATWCGPCRQSIPEVRQVFEKYKSQGLEVMSISDEEAETLRDFEKKSPSPYPIYRDTDSSAARAFTVDSIPTFVLVGKDGKIMADLRGYEAGEIERMVAQAIQ